jgi:hypothetical protein
MASVSVLSPNQYKMARKILQLHCREIAGELFNNYCYADEEIAARMRVRIMSR